jgi:hypothetical protein
MLVTAQAVGTAVTGAVLILGVSALVIWGATVLTRLPGRHARTSVPVSA